MLRWWPIGRPAWPLRRPFLLLTNRRVEAQAPAPAPPPAVVYVTVAGLLITQAEGKVRLRDITFVGGISASILVKLFDAETELQIGTDKTAGPGTSLDIPSTAVTVGQIVNFKYTATTEAAGYTNRTTLTFLTSVVIIDDGELPGYLPIDPPPGQTPPP